MIQNAQVRLWFCRACWIVFAAIFGVLFYLLIDRTPPYLFHTGSITIEHAPPERDKIHIRWKATVNRFCPGTVQRYVVDSARNIHRYDAAPAAPPAPGVNPEDFLYRTIDVPKAAAPGPAEYFALACYECNPLHHWFPICTPTPRIPFSIPAQDIGATGARGEKGEPGSPGVGCSGEGEGRVCREQ